MDQQMRVQMITQDAKMILAAAPPDNWKRPPGRPRIMWLNTVQHHLRAYNLTLNEAVDLAQNRPLCRLMSTCGATYYALLVVHARTEREEHSITLSIVFLLQVGCEPALADLGFFSGGVTLGTRASVEEVWAYGRMNLARGGAQNDIEIT